MKKHQLVGIVALAMCAGTAVAQSTWNMATAYPDTNFHTRNIKQFAEEVDKETDGKLKITVHSSGGLLKMPEIKRAIQTGQIPAGEIFIGTMANEAPIYAFDSIPFMVTGYDQEQDLWEAVRPFIEERLGKQNLHVLFSVGWPASGMYTKNEITKTADLDGLKIRAPSASYADFAKRMGSTPTVIQAADIAQAFLTGQADAMLTSSVTGVESQAWDYLDNFYHAPIVIPQNIVLVNKKAWDALDPAVQEAVTAAAQRAQDRGWEMSESEDMAAAEKLGETRMAVHQLTPELQEHMRDVGTQMAKDWMDKLSEPERDAVKQVLGN